MFYCVQNQFKHLSDTTQELNISKAKLYLCLTKYHAMI